MHDSFVRVPLTRSPKRASRAHAGADAQLTAVRRGAESFTPREAAVPTYALFAHLEICLLTESDSPRMHTRQMYGGKNAPRGIPALIGSAARLGGLHSTPGSIVGLLAAAGQRLVYLLPL